MPERRAPMGSKFLLLFSPTGCLSDGALGMEAEDMDLLREYACSHSEQAFRTLVARHINIVYAVALRQTGNAQLAEDVTQAVFIVLAEKAASIPKRAILAGWLFRATRYAAANARRAEARREHWEQKAAQMEPQSPSESELEQVTPLLNEALEELPELDRAAILLRFFETKSMEEVGRTLGTTESAAKMRLSRAVEKLRAIFRKRGVVVPASVVLAALSAQAANAAPVGLAATVATSALLNQSSTSTFIIVKGTLKVMAQAKAKKLAIAALVLLFGGTAAVVVQQTLQKRSASTTDSAANTGKGVVAAEPTGTPATATATTNSKVLVFRNIPSWNRNPDFEDRLAELGAEFEVKPADLMATTDLSAYRYIVIPGAQWRTDFYQTYAANAARFDQYVNNGGVLVLELNGAEREGISLPGGVSMVRHSSLDNTILFPDHPILVPFGGRPIRANSSSHGYLTGVPPDAMVLAAETVDGQADREKPTFVEYKYGAGRVIAACQCFHDQDRSGRGVLMPTLLSYAAERKWYSPKK
jgi:RNA polymerase sigma factor (sigma-70 family)